MFDAAHLAIFITATIALLIIPGPTVLYIVARSLEQGRIAGFISVLGIGCASIVHVIFAALGLSALIMQFVLAFNMIKIFGAAYLVYLGIRTLMNQNRPTEVSVIKTIKLSQVFMQGFIVNLFNPKTALFFLAFLPQFADPSRGPIWLQICILGAIFVGIAIVNDGLLALIAGTTKKFFTGSMITAQVQKYISGTIYIILGLAMAFSGNSRGK